MTEDLARETIVQDAAPISAAQLEQALAGLEGWTACDGGKAIRRAFETRNFARAQVIAGLAGGVGEMAGHHPDIAYGWGYCRVTFTTHSAQGVTSNDLICAARLNAVA